MNRDEQFIMGLVSRGVFSIDDQGRIWRHKIRLSRHNDYRPLGEPRRAESTSGNGYHVLDVSTNGIKYRTKAHRIVWIAHHGDIDGSLTINHKNGIKTDNRIENLELITIRENLLHACKIGLISGARPGEGHPLSKLKNEDVSQIRAMYATGQYTLSELGWLFGVGETQIGRIIRGTRWRHIENPYDFRRYGAAKLNQEQVKAIRLRYAESGLSQSALAAEFGISIAQIGRIVRREAWKHV